MYAKKLMLVAVTILATCFIFYQSLQPAVVSGSYSYSLLMVLREWLSFIPLLDDLTNHYLRKTAHWFEFFLQSLFLSVVFFQFSAKRRNFLYVLLLGLLTAVFDEFIQLFVPGRAGMVQDILLDYSGTISGVIMYMLCRFVLKKAK